MKKVIIDNNTHQNLYNIIKESILPIIEIEKEKKLIKGFGKVDDDKEFYVSYEYLNNLLTTNINLETSKEQNIIKLYHQYTDSLEKIQNIIKTIYNNREINLSGYFLYPKNGFMGWHTNSDNPCKRLYISLADEDKQSYFRYYDEASKQIVTDYDSTDIILREFDVTGNEPYFWHCVYSKCNRLSIGFRII